MNQETIDQINEYKVQILMIFISILATLVSITIIKLLIDVARGYIKYSQVRWKILFRSRLVAIVILIVISYFTYLSLKNYRKDSSTNNYLFLISNLFILIGALLRVLNLFNDRQEVTGEEDIF